MRQIHGDTETSKLFYLRHLVRALAIAIRPSSPRRPYRVRVLTHWLRAALAESLHREAAWMRGLEVPVPLPSTLRRRLVLEHTEIAGIDALCVAPRGIGERGLLLYFHGGGYNFCSTNTHRGLLSHLSAACGVRFGHPVEIARGRRRVTAWRGAALALDRSHRER